MIKYRLKTERFITREAQATLPTPFGTFQIIGYKNQITNGENVALVLESEDKNKIPLVRMHSECLTGDVFHSLRCDCGNQLHAALKMIQEHGCGALVYIKEHEGRGIGLINKIKAYALQDEGQDTVQANVSLGFEPDLRDYGIGAQILLDLNFKKFNLITNNPKKIIGLKGYDLEVVERIPTKAYVNEFNQKYMETKVKKMEHMLNL